MIKKLILITILFTNILLAKSEFMKICDNPTSEQHIVIKRIIGKEYNSEICKDFEIKNNRNLNGNYRVRSFVKRDYDKKKAILSDISPFVVYTSLEDLSIQNNNVTDINPLKNLKNLKELDISYNPISNISALKNLTKLESLRLSQNDLKDLKPLEGLKNLKYLTLIGSKNIKELDISAISNLDNLTDLAIIGINPKNICVLNKLTQLTVLKITGKAIKDISCLTKLTNLKSIELNYSSIENIDALSNYKKLEYINIDDTLIKNLKGLKDLEHFHTVYIRRNKNLEDTSSVSYKKLGNFEAFDNPKLKWCAPKTYNDIVNQVSCYEKDGTLKSWWKRLLRI